MGVVRNLSIRLKIGIMIGLSVLFLTIISFIGYFYINKLAADSKSIYEDSLLPVKWLNEIRENNRGIESDTLELMLTQDVSFNKKLMDDVDRRDRENDELMKLYEASKLDSREKELLRQYQAIVASYRTARGKTLQLAYENKNAEAYKVFVQEVSKWRDELNAIARELIDYDSQVAEQLSQRAQEDSDTANRVTLLISIACTALFLSAGVAISLMITRPIAQMQRLMGHAESGDLTVTGNYPYRDEVGRLMGSFNVMIRSLRNLIFKVNESALTIAASAEELTASAEQSTNASEQVAHSSQELAAGLEKQVTSVSEATASVQQMAASIQHIEQSSREVSQLAANASAASQEGARSVQEIKEQMQQIHRASQLTQSILNALGKRAEEIGNIVGIINEIANQTNLLSLNASIEAARAGEMGRGFSVVANEVKKLAEQSGKSAAQIAELIQTIQKETVVAVDSMNQGSAQVELGLQKSESVRRVFDKIEQSVADVSTKVNEVSDAIEQLAAGSEQIVKAIEVISVVSQEGMSASQETSAASQEQHATMEEIANSAASLAALSEELQLELSKFKL